MDARAAAAILAQVAGALDAAHARGLVHRDVKPANILLSLGAGADQGDHAYLTDFGLTKRGGSETSLTAAGGFAGTLAYIAPEQVDGREIDGRADQYSLACMAFECLTGSVPFVRETDIATAMAHIKDPPPSALALQPTLPAGVDAVLARGMAKAPDDRYPTCGAFIADLRGVLGLTSSYVAPVGRSARAATHARAAGRRRRDRPRARGRRRGLDRRGAGRHRHGALREPVDAPPPRDARAQPDGGRLPERGRDGAAGGAPGRSGGDLRPRIVQAGRVADFGDRHAVASLSCAPPASSGVNLVEVRRFPYLGTTAGNSGFTTESAISGTRHTARTVATAPRRRGSMGAG